MRIQKLLLLIVLLGLSGSVFGGEIEQPILRYKLDRFYFDIGSEKLLFENAPVLVIHNQDTIVKTSIEKTLPGISYTYPLDTAVTIPLKQLRARILTADIDRDNPVTIRLLIPEYHALALLTQRFLGQNPMLPESTDNGNQIRILDETTSIRPAPDKISSTDIVYEYALDENESYATHPAPYVAVVIPNHNKSYNKDIFLSASLYYRFDDQKLPFMFDGLAEPVACLFPSDSVCDRQYQFDSNQGRKMLGYSTELPREISIAITHPSLHKTAQYFADVFSRDRIMVSVTEDSFTADLILTYIPFIQKHPEIGLSYLLDHIRSRPQRSPEQLEQLDLIENNLETLPEVLTEGYRHYYYSLVDYTYKYRLGVFPLFRPQLALKHSSAIYNCPFDSNGFLDYRSIVKIIQPESKKAVRP